MVIKLDTHKKQQSTFPNPLSNEAFGFPRLFRDLAWGATHQDHKHLETTAWSPHLAPAPDLAGPVLRTHLVTACSTRRKASLTRQGERTAPNELKCAERSHCCPRQSWRPALLLPSTPNSTSWPPTSVCEPIKKHPLSSVWKLLRGKFAAQSWLLTSALIGGLSRLWLQGQCHLEEQLEAAVRRRIILMNTFPFNCMGISRSH